MRSLCQPECAIVVLRFKERFSVPLPSGYRDILMNVTIAGCALVLELQLHLQDIVRYKKEAHKIYDLARAAGWDGDYA